MSELPAASEVLDVDTPLGAARWYLDGSRTAPTVLALGHGAGGGVDAPDLAWVASHLAGGDLLVARFEQPWRTAGKRVAPAPGRLDQAWLPSVAGLLAELGRSTDRRLVLGGRSAGARVACRTAGELGADAVLALSFPLHPPGRPERSRAQELDGVPAPLLVVQGERDPFGDPDELLAALPGHRFPARVLVATGCPHELVPARRSGLDVAGLWGTLAAPVLSFVLSSTLPPAGVAPE